MLNTSGINWCSHNSLNASTLFIFIYLFCCKVVCKRWMKGRMHVSFSVCMYEGRRLTSGGAPQKFSTLVCETGNVTGIYCPLIGFAGWEVIPNDQSVSVCTALRLQECDTHPRSNMYFLRVLKVGSSQSMCFAKRTVSLGHKSLCLRELVQILSAI